MTHSALAPEEVARLKKAATAASLATATVMIGLKVGAWAITDSISVLTSMMDSILDFSVGLMNFVAVRKALSPANRFHRFGFGKVEPLAVLAEAVFLFGVAIMIIIEAIDRLRHPHPISHAELGAWAMAAVIVLTIGLLIYQRHVIRKTGSLVVQADAIHYAADVMIHVGIIFSLLLSDLAGVFWVDSAFACGVAFYLVWNAKTILSESVGILLDGELPDNERHKIRDLALSHPEVKGVHDLRTRSAGPQKFIQLHVEMNPNLSLRDAHRYTEETIDLILAAYPDAEVQIHEEPVGMPRHRSWCAEAGPIIPGQYAGPKD
ncbi:zinc transporter [Magnetospirillum gryphiswaldense MSR-1 v2]|uniref:Protein p34 n=1 Tax=Magnetospirillum gryphiswaldense (strain DSM 6361 / JCM 21280 / NBRC 15271 / MSR-1) TaxID=431944 RepID=V6F2E8_MAGGM|nr:cation diffusion facilitator family transporter [Magnetospirillum gryphiswaldense]CDK99562.1 zinc transporter [Magnetospirillum gryphiswaldense MSR-1 v2]